ncbi:MAG: DUF1616 domain-containing protein [archaeon]
MADILSLATGIIILVIVLIVPGYFLALGFFPKRKDLDAIERATFSLVFSIIFIPLAMLVENLLLGIRINQLSVWGTVLFLVLAGVVAWFVRTRKLGKNEGQPICPLLRA